LKGFARVFGQDRGMVDDARAEDDVAAITAVVTAYFQSWFRGEPELMRSVLHPALTKRTPANPGGPDLTLLEDNATSMVASVSRGPRPQYEHWQDVDVLDVSQDIATAKVRSQPFVEYVHLARFGDKWLIVNALYLDAPGAP
jgi:hypothetical protein